MRHSAYLAALLTVLAGPSFGQDQSAAEAAAAPEGAIMVELNKLVSTDNACQIYFVVDNRGPEPLKELQVDAYLFSKEGVILRGVALPFTDLRSGRTSVSAFDLPDLACDDVGRVLVNKVLVCTDGEGAPVEGCGDRLTVTSRAEASFQ